MTDMAIMADIARLRNDTQGDSRICVAVLDGPVDLTHPCFAGADLTAVATLAGDDGPSPLSSQHGTHVASVIFGTPDSPVPGLAPGCRGLIVPIFSDAKGHPPQLDLARAIDQAVEAGAHIINVSGGQRVADGEANELLERSIRQAAEQNVLVVAAAGNEGCACLHVPAAVAAVLAVGAVDNAGRPLPLSNWGESYRVQGILAPGQDILGAMPGGGTARLTGTSFATPIVTGVVALLLSRLLQRGEPPDPARVRAALLQSAGPCDLTGLDDPDLNRCLAGTLNVNGALAILEGEPMTEQTLPQTEPDGQIAPSGCACQPEEEIIVAQRRVDDDDDNRNKLAPAAAEPSAPKPAAKPSAGISPSREPATTPAPQEMGGKVYALGTLGYDFSSEARRDTFKQLMPPYQIDQTVVPANPYDARQLCDYLETDLSEAKSLIWVLNVEMTPIYAIEPVGPFSRDVYELLRKLLSGQIAAESSDDYIERVSIPGQLSGRSIRLFSGQTVPVVEVENPRGIYGWHVNVLVEAAVKAAGTDNEAVRKSLKNFLDRVYYDLRNLGLTAHDRALNFAATNAFQVASTFSDAVAGGMHLADIEVVKSPFCRMDSDCWDVMLKFFDPENDRRARQVYRFTIDVSDLVPVTLGEVRSWSVPH